MSTYSHSYSSTSSSSSIGPSTPLMQSDSFYDTPSTGLITPPGTLKDYARSLKARHTLGMAAAMKSLPIERTPRSNRSRSMYDMDDNPFDRLYSLSPTGLPRSDTFGSLAGELGEETMLAKPRSREPSREGKEAPQPWRPSLLKFARKESSGSTPGSYSSEASFEGGTADDHLRIYGAHSDLPSPSPSVPLSRTPGLGTPAAVEDDSPFSLSAYLQPSPALFVPPSQSESTRTRKQASNRISVASTMTTSSVASSSTIMSSSSSGTVIATAQVAALKRPSMLRPRPKAHPHDDSAGYGLDERYNEQPAYMPVRPGSTSTLGYMGTGMDVDADVGPEFGVAPSPHADASAAARGISFSTEKREMQEDGRSMSEVMVAMAGLRCQRGRNRYRPRQ